MWESELAWTATVWDHTVTVRRTIGAGMASSWLAGDGWGVWMARDGSGWLGMAGDRDGSGWLEMAGDGWGWLLAEDLGDGSGWFVGGGSACPV
jgi:hypothetical protein